MRKNNSSDENDLSPFDQDDAAPCSAACKDAMLLVMATDKQIRSI